jgi:hypothetical protein
LPEILLVVLPPGIFFLAGLIVACVALLFGRTVVRGVFVALLDARTFFFSPSSSCGLLGCSGSPVLPRSGGVFRSDDGLAGSGDDQGEQEQQDQDR